ncbi:MAG: ATP-binding protein, partial [Burkholderiaceae bacterium]
MRRRRRQLWRTYAIWIASSITLAVVGSGLAQLWLLQRETRLTVEALQALEAAKATSRIDRFIGDVEALLRSTLMLLDSGHLHDDTDVEIEFYRLLKQSKAIDSLTWIDGQGHARVQIGRMSSDGVGTQQDRSRDALFTQAQPNQPWFGDVSFVGNHPRLPMSLRGAGRRSGVIAAQVDLTQLRHIVGDIRFGIGGYAYVVDPRGMLLAHPDIHQVLARADWSDRPPVRADTSDGSPLIEFRSPAGQPIVARAAALSIPQWRLITEQPRDEAYALMRSALAIAAAIVLLTTLAGCYVGLLLARRVVKPIGQLADGARRIGDGQLDHRIELARDDELGLLAEGFNQMAQRLRQSHALLETRIAQRTAELVQANAALQLKREEAEQASQAKTRFLASASHDLRQPLHTISLLVGVLRRQRFAPEVDRLIGNIEVSVSAMEGLFASLLDISKLDAGMAQPQLSECALAELLRVIEVNHAPEAERKRLRLAVVASPAVVRTDPALLERVMNNLVSNAIRYTERGTVLVGVRRRRDCVELQVRDTGIGIDAGQQQHVFDEFYQVDNPERDRTKGLGLGLSIVKRTLELLDHGFSLHSAPGRGTCFSIRLPVVAARSWQTPSAARSVEPSIAGAFIAVIDDEAGTRQAMHALCSSWGAHALTAASAQECIARLDEHLRNPDLILCDYRLREHQDG